MNCSQAAPPVPERSIGAVRSKGASSLPPLAPGSVVITVDVPLADGRAYPVLVGDGVLGALSGVLPERARKVAVVTQRGVPVEVDPGRDHRVFTIDDGEAAKTMATVEQLCEAFADWGLTRTDCVVGLGGGPGDRCRRASPRRSTTAGFAVVHVATTLLGQIDAAIGGKTGVNLPQGKNLVGAYWQPSAVLCDTATLASLPPREWRCGLGELAKYHWLGGGRLDELALDERVAACVRIKAEVVAADERESGRRALLNYGHTLAHALEIAGGHELRHGEAVAIGLVYLAELARSWVASTTPRSPSTVVWSPATTCRPGCRRGSRTPSWWS